MKNILSVYAISVLKSNNRFKGKLTGLALVLFVITGHLNAQSLTISSSGETGGSGTNWTTSGTNPITISVSEGDANIAPSVIINFLNDSISVDVYSPLDIRLSDVISKISAGTATLNFNAGRDIFIQADISSSSNGLNLTFNSDSDNDNIGAITNSANISSNGGSVTFQDDLTFNGTSAQSVTSGAAAIVFSGEVMLSNTSGISLTTSNANVTFSGTVNSGNSYSLDATVKTWIDAYTAHSSATSYLATITSKMELTAAMAVVPAGGAWLGGSDQETEGTWKWVTGPEAGTVFWTTALAQGIKGYLGTEGSYVNWNDGEPNNSGSAEDALQIRNNTDGYWNDLPTGGTTTLTSVVENELLPSPLVINAGTGTVSFGGAVGAGKPLKSLIVTAATTAINGGYVITNSNSSTGGQSYSGNITLGSPSTTLSLLDTPSDFTLLAAKSITNANEGDATLVLKTTSGIVIEANGSISSSVGKLNIVLWADTDENGGSVISNSGSNLSTNGGHLWMGGGSGSTTWNGLTVGDGYATGTTGTGILLDDVTINSGAGDISIAGKSTSTNAASHGIHLKYTTSSTLTASGGSISLLGVGGAATSNPANCDGVRLEGTLQTATGNINITGYSNTEAQSEGIAVEPTGSLTSTSSGNFSLAADNIYFATGATASSAGELALSPVTTSAAIGIAGADGALLLPSTRFTNNFSDGFSLIIIGSSTQSGNINLNTIDFRDNMRFQTSGSVVVNSSQTIGVPNGIKLQIDNDLQMRTGAKIQKILSQLN